MMEAAKVGIQVIVGIQVQQEVVVGEEADLVSVEAVEVVEVVEVAQQEQLVLLVLQVLQVEPVEPVEHHRPLIYWLVYFQVPQEQPH